MQVQSSTLAFIDACEHVDSFQKASRVFVTGSDAFFKGLTQAGAKEGLDQMLNFAGGGCAVSYIASAHHLREFQVSQLLLVCSVLLVSIAASKLQQIGWVQGSHSTVHRIRQSCNLADFEDAAWPMDNM
jgi:hypothetical protein